VDVSYLNIGGTFYYLCSVLDGWSRSITHWEIREAMTEADIEQVIQRAREQFTSVTPRIISGNGPQFIAKDFKEFIRICGMTQVRTSPYYPQGNGKIERFHRTIKGDGIRTETPLSLEGARRIVARYVEHDNTARLHSAIGYVTPEAKLQGREKAILLPRRQIPVPAEAKQRAIAGGGQSRTGPQRSLCPGSLRLSLVLWPATATRYPARVQQSCARVRRAHSRDGRDADAPPPSAGEQGNVFRHPSVLCGPCVGSRNFPGLRHRWRNSHLPWP